MIVAAHLQLGIIGYQLNFLEKSCYNCAIYCCLSMRKLCIQSLLLYKNMRLQFHTFLRGMLPHDNL